MKKIIIAIIILYFSPLYWRGVGGEVYSQSNNYWVIGRNCGIDFNTNPPTVDSSTTNPYFLNQCNAMINDKNGHLLFYANGYRIFDKTYHIMPHGNNFDSSKYMNQYIAGGGYTPLVNGGIILPFVKDSNMFYFFYNDLEYNSSGDYLPSKIRCVFVDRRLNGGLGDVTIRDSTILCCDSLNSCNIFVIRHGNGKDWWLIARRYQSNVFYKILIDSVGIHQPITQSIGNIYYDNNIYHGVSNVSIDGSKLIYIFNSLSNVHIGETDIYDFDRCTGVLSNYQKVPSQDALDTFPALSVILSPNNRFVYATTGFKMYQYDLLNSNPYSSKINVGNWDGSHLLANTYFWQMRNAPDGKIYVSTYGSTNVLHVINNPDSFGMACNFVQKQIRVGSYNGTTIHFSDGGLPNMPNYKLGALNCNVGIENLSTENDGLNIFPNPTHSSFTINFSNDWNNAAIKVFNLTGQMIVEKQNQNGKQFSIDLSNQSAGIYFVEVQTATNIYRSKVVKE